MFNVNMVKLKVKFQLYMSNFHCQIHNLETRSITYWLDNFKLKCQQNIIGHVSYIINIKLFCGCVKNRAKIAHISISDVSEMGILIFSDDRCNIIYGR